MKIHRKTTKIVWHAFLDFDKLKISEHHEKFCMCVCVCVGGGSFTCPVCNNNYVGTISQDVYTIYMYIISYNNDNNTSNVYI